MIAQHIPQLLRRFLGRGLCSFLFPDRAEEETPIARRAVSGSLCVCVRNLRSLLITEFVLEARHNYQKERIDTRNTVESYRTKSRSTEHIPPSVRPTWKESCCFSWDAASVHRQRDLPGKRRLLPGL